MIFGSYGESIFSFARTCQAVFCSGFWRGAIFIPTDNVADGVNYFSLPVCTVKGPVELTVGYTWTLLRLVLVLVMCSTGRGGGGGQRWAWFKVVQRETGARRRPNQEGAGLRRKREGRAVGSRGEARPEGGLPGIDPAGRLLAPARAGPSMAFRDRANEGEHEGSQGHRPRPWRQAGRCHLPACASHLRVRATGSGVTGLLTSRSWEKLKHVPASPPPLHTGEAWGRRWPRSQTQRLSRSPRGPLSQPPRLSSALWCPQVCSVVLGFVVSWK